MQQLPKILLWMGYLHYIFGHLIDIDLKFKILNAKIKKESPTVDKYNYELS